MESTASPPAITIRVARVIGGLQAEVYRAWTDAATKPTWWGKSGRGELTRCEMDVRVGGRFRYEMRMPNATAEAASGEYVEVSPPQRLIFTWPANPDGSGEGETSVTFEFVDLRDGTTRCVVTHQGIVDQRIATTYRAAWSNVLQDLGMLFARRV